MRLGLYYSGGLDWSFEGRPIQDLPDLFARIPTDPAYAAYVDTHWRELIDRYQPSVLWNDIAYPTGTDTRRLFADYYNAVPDGVVNDRFAQYNLGAEGSLRYRVMLWGVKTLAPPLIKWRGTAAAPAGAHADFRTPEYASFGKIAKTKWETCRGIGYSFCYNRAETDAHMIDPAELVRMFADIVSKNGNLLLNVGPMADGTIPEIQLSRLRALGVWLKVNGEAIFGTRPWIRAEGATEDGTELRFTRRGEILHAILLGTPPGEQIKLKGVTAPTGASITLLGRDGDLAWTQEGEDLAVTLPERLPDAPAHALRIAPIV